MQRLLGPILLLIPLLVLGGCGAKSRSHVWRPPATTAPAATPQAVPSDQRPLLEDDMDKASLIQAIDRSLAYYEKPASPSVPGGGGSPLGSREEMKGTLKAFRAILEGDGTPETKAARIRESFHFKRADGRDGAGGVLFTGYFAPLLKGSPVRTDRFRYPLYRPPPELLKSDGAISYTREEIDTREALAGRSLELFWVDDPVALFFLHIQGSGTIELPDGRLVRISYARSNGRPFRSISLYMQSQGKPTGGSLSYKAIRQYLTDHPDERSQILNHNERYIFFRIVESDPIGAIGVPLTPGRSIAVDLDLFPPGAIALIQTRKPLFDAEGNVRTWVPFSRFVLSQDTGAAIKGPGRVDLFCGSGSEAELTAGSMKEQGELHYLILKQ